MKYNVWTTGNHFDVAKKILDQIRLVIKVGVTKKKATNKMVHIIKQYKNLRHTIKQSRWGTRLDGVDKISHKDCKL